MGSSQTKADSPVGNLSTEECIVLKKTFNKINKSEKNSSLDCSYRNFQQYCEVYLDDWLARKISDKLATKPLKGSELRIPLVHFLNFISSAVKGSFDDKFEIIWSMAIESGKEERTTIQAGEILQYTRSIVESYLKCTEALPSTKSWAHSIPVSADSISDLAQCLLLELFHRDVLPKDILTVDSTVQSRRDAAAKQYTMEEVLTAFSKSVLFLNLQNSIMSHCFDFEKSTYFVSTMIPLCQKSHPAADVSILDLPKLIFLNSQLTPELRKEWRFLFSTASHGASFSKFLTSIQEKGPTLIIIRDLSGHIFGGFASQSWRAGPKFFGNDQSFLFHLSPKFVTYPPTGYNKNFLYLNVQQKTMPNGLGFGGTLEYFGLWLDAEFGKGKSSQSCTTYVNPPLTTLEFEIEHLEVWGVGPEPQINENDRIDKSILDKDPEAKAMMEILDKPSHSDGYREEPKD